MLSELSRLTARLLRVVTLRKLQRGDAQLRSQGVTSAIVPVYSKYLRENPIHNPKGKAPIPVMVEFVSDGNDAF